MNILERIAESQRAEVARRRRRRSLRDLREELGTIAAAGAQRVTLGAALRRQPGEGVRFICEIRRASPSPDVSPGDLDAAALAQTYERSGAAAIAVVTEERFLLGDRRSLRAVRAASSCAILMKDFIVDVYQLVEARWLGADAVLLVAALLDRDALRAFLDEAAQLGLECLVEVHDEAELEASVEAGATIVGIDNRDLASFQVTLDTTERLSRLLPADRVLVSESGIRSRDDVLRLERSPVDALLVDEALMRSSGPAEMLGRLMGR